MFVPRVFAITLMIVALLSPTASIADTVERSVLTNKRIVILGGASIRNADCEGAPREFKLKTKPKLGVVSANITSRPFNRVGNTGFENCIGFVTDMTNIFYTAGPNKGVEKLRFDEYLENGKKIRRTIEISVE